MIFLGLTAIALLLLIILGWLCNQRLNKRQRTFRHLLDSADILEHQLHECRHRTQSLKLLLVNLPNEISAQATAALAAVEHSVREALCDVLAHRLWVGQHAASANQTQLDTAYQTMCASKTLLETQLNQLTDISQEMARTSGIPHTNSSA